MRTVTSRRTRRQHYHSPQSRDISYYRCIPNVCWANGDFLRCLYCFGSWHRDVCSILSPNQAQQHCNTLSVSRRHEDSEPKDLSIFCIPLNARRTHASDEEDGHLTSTVLLRI
ncbi:hypothetical protein CPC08DRAFT_713928 [Agrocybe pediades]|nr:hypothetical protein CPC08DRAFT_713928 [Agrocybe pediades]